MTRKLRPLERSRRERAAIAICKASHERCDDLFKCPCERTPAVCDAMLSAADAAARQLLDDDAFCAFLAERRGEAGVAFG